MLFIAFLYSIYINSEQPHGLDKVRALSVSHSFSLFLFSINSPDWGFPELGSDTGDLSVKILQLLFPLSCFGQLCRCQHVSAKILLLHFQRLH